MYWNVGHARGLDALQEGREGSSEARTDALRSLGRVGRACGLQPCLCGCGREGAQQLGRVVPHRPLRPPGWGEEAWAVGARGWSARQGWWDPGREQGEGQEAAEVRRLEGRRRELLGKQGPQLPLDNRLQCKGREVQVPCGRGESG